MSQAFLDEMLSTIPPIAKALVASTMPNILENETFKAVATTVEALAQQDGLDIGTFIKSGRAVEVLRALAAGAAKPSLPDTDMFVCPKCNHVTYEFNS